MAAVWVTAYGGFDKLDYRTDAGLVGWGETMTPRSYRLPTLSATARVGVEVDPSVIGALVAEYSP